MSEICNISLCTGAGQRMGAQDPVGVNQGAEPPESGQESCLPRQCGRICIAQPAPALIPSNAALSAPFCVSLMS